MSGRDNNREDKNVTEKQLDKSSTSSQAVFSSEEEKRALEKKYTTTISPEAIAAAERAIRQQAERDEFEDMTLSEEKIRENIARRKVAEILEKEARQKAEEAKRELLEKQKKAAEAKAEAARKTHEKVKSELHFEKNESVRAVATDKIQTWIEEEASKKQLQKIERKTQDNLRQKQAELEKRRKVEARKAAQQAKREEEHKRRDAIKKQKLKLKQQKEEDQKRKEERDLLIARQRALQKAEREKQKRAEKAKAEAEHRERKASIKAERAEKQRLRKEKRIARKQAEKGGGIVAVHGTVVQTEIQPVAAFSWKQLLGISKRKEIKEAVTPEIKQQLIIENEKLTAEARDAAAQLAEGIKIRQRNSRIAAKTRVFLNFCEEKKKPLLVAFSIVLMVLIGGAGVWNYCTAYEYSYNGAALGYVKNKEDVLQVTEMVQKELTEEKNVEVVVDASDDIGFHRVNTLNKNIVIDSADDVLRRLTYLGDLNIKAWGIYIDGKKVGAVENKTIAAEVLTTIEDRYASHKEGTVIKEAAIVEDIRIQKSNTNLKDLLNADMMVDKLCTSGVKEAVHTVVRGETLASIAKDHNLTEEEILKDNPDVKREKLVVGSALTLHETAPIMTVRIVEERNYVEKTEYKTIKKKDKDLYEGYTEVEQKGKKGLSELTDETISINGEVVETVNLKKEIKEEPVEKIVRVGTKERPPTVGSGTYIWPANRGTYTVTSEFKWRWGRQHEGMDLGCRTGTDVLATDGGTVIHAGYMGGYGLLVIIDHQNGMQSYYGHNSVLLVGTGEKVFQGQHIAEAGNTGRSTGSHIHFGIKDHGSFKNPRNYLP